VLPLDELKDERKAETDAVLAQVGDRYAQFMIDHVTEHVAHSLSSAACSPKQLVNRFMIEG
jgi:hypothetical protein